MPLLAAMAFLSKESAAPLPLVMVALDLALGYGPRTSIRQPRIWVSRYLPVFAVLLGYLAVRSVLVTTAPGSPFLGMGAGVVGLTMVRTVVLYARMLLVPWPLCAYYDPSIWPPVADPLDPLVLLGAAICILYVLAMAVAWRRDRRVLALLLFVPLVMAPYMHIVSFRTIAGERFLYLASAALCGLAGMAWAGERSPQSEAKPAAWSRVALVAGLAVLLALSGITAVRNADWRSNRTIMEAKVRDFPESFDAHFALGRYILDVEAKPAEAVPHLERANEIWPGFERGQQILDQARSPAGP